MPQNSARYYRYHALPFSSLDATVPKHAKKLATMPVGISKQILEKRLAMKLKQHQVAKVLGVSRGLLCQWELGNTMPQECYAAKIRVFLECS